MKKETLEIIKTLLENEKAMTEDRLLKDVVFAYNYTDSAKKYKKACDALDDFLDFMEDM